MWETRLRRGGGGGLVSKITEGGREEEANGGKQGCCLPRRPPVSRRVVGETYSQVAERGHTSSDSQRGSPTPVLSSAPPNA